MRQEDSLKEMEEMLSWMVSTPELSEADRKTVCAGFLPGFALKTDPQILQRLVKPHLGKIVSHDLYIAALELCTGTQLRAAHSKCAVAVVRESRANERAEIMEEKALKMRRVVLDTEGCLRALIRKNETTPGEEAKVERMLGEVRDTALVLDLDPYF
ncbi:unnamed protein product [Amoebophrya sp. A25]|nr:unnamed protein product [Amoebophrya sp. A25]|eukprot:GSA25T00000619001.1